MSKENGTFEPAVVIHELLLPWAARKSRSMRTTPRLAAPGGMLLAILCQVMPSLVPQVRSPNRCARCRFPQLQPLKGRCAKVPYRRRKTGSEGPVGGGLPLAILSNL